MQRNQDFLSKESIGQTVVAAVLGNPRGHNNLVDALEAQERMEAAIAHYRQALRLQPDRTEARKI